MHEKPNTETLATKIAVKPKNRVPSSTANDDAEDAGDSGKQEKPHSQTNAKKTTDSDKTAAPNDKPHSFLEDVQAGIQNEVSKIKNDCQRG